MLEFSSRYRLFLRFILGALLLYPFLKHGIVDPWNLGYVGGDFTIYYRAAEKLAAGQSPYPLEALAARAQGEGSAVWGEYPYPPLLARLLIPLTAFEVLWAKRVYIAVCLAAFFWVLIPFLGKRYEPEFERWGLAAVLLGWGPLIYSIRLGQCELLAMPLLALAWRFLAHDSDRNSPERGRRGEVVAGLCLGFAAMIRVTPILMLPALLVAFRWRLALWFCVGAFLNLLLAGPATSIDFFTQVLPSMSDVSGMRHCPAFHVLILRAVDSLAPHTADPGWWTDRAAFLGTFASGLFYTGILVFLFLERKKIHTEALVLIGLYLAPLFAGKNPHHYALAVFPVMAGAAILIRKIREGRTSRTLLAAWILCLIPSFDYWRPTQFLADRFGSSVSLDSVILDILGNLGAFSIVLVLLTRSLQPEPSKGGPGPLHSRGGSVTIPTS